MTESEWRDVEPYAGSAPTRDFLHRHDGRDVPGALWLPADDTPKALILVGHGGSRHKREETTLEVIAAIVEQHGMAAAAIDGPLHGSRRGDRSPDPGATQKDFLDLWETPGNGIADMVADWQVSLTALLDLPELTSVPVGYYGVSMGTAFGLPLVAADSRITAAVLGMWGNNYSNSQILVDKAADVSCPVLFLHKSEDNFFTLDGALEIYEALAGDKRFLMNEGPHVPATEEQIEASMRFFEGVFG